MRNGQSSVVSGLTLRRTGFTLVVFIQYSNMYILIKLDILRDEIFKTNSMRHNWFYILFTNV